MAGKVEDGLESHLGIAFVEHDIGLRYQCFRHGCKFKCKSDSKLKQHMLEEHDVHYKEIETEYCRLLNND